MVRWVGDEPAHRIFLCLANRGCRAGLARVSPGLARSRRASPGLAGRPASDECRRHRFGRPGRISAPGAGIRRDLGRIRSVTCAGCRNPT